MDRPDFLHLIEQLFAIHPVVALLGRRQCGKTTLARMLADRTTDSVNHFDLEDPTDLAALVAPRLALQKELWRVPLQRNDGNSGEFHDGSKRQLKFENQEGLSK